MPNILQSLQGRDIGYLRIVARLWGIDIKANDTETVLNELSSALLDPDLVTETIETLPGYARAALEALASAEGRLPWAEFVRRFGEIRAAGPGRRDREQIFLHPVSGAEMLFYRALVARAFFDLPAGAQEFAYLPDDLTALVKHWQVQKPPPSIGGLITLQGEGPLGRPAIPREHAHFLPPCTRLVDDATTLLAALRMGIPLPGTRIPSGVVMEFLATAKIIRPASREGGSGNGFPQVEQVRLFLEAGRDDALDQLTRAWRVGETFNELRQAPGIVCEGDWNNRPLATREFLLNTLESIPVGTWWSLPAFIHGIKEKYPDFQRPAGDYDSWFIKRISDGAYLRGFDSWDEVDGALIRYLISGPLYWLGQVDLATHDGEDVVSAFRRRREKPHSPRDENARLHVSSQGKIVIPRWLARAARYQIARFCEWEEDKDDEYRYRLTTDSLKRAGEQGLKINQLLSLLAKNAAAEIPPTIIKALKQWEKKGIEARLESQTILRVSRPEIIEELRKSRAGRFLGESLGPAAVIVKAGAQSKVSAALAELGLLTEEMHAG
jgi:hypothetical protein